MQKEDTKKDKYDVAVVGAGPAGIITAGKAASLGLKVILIEKNSAPARKLLLTGNGRCNLTNAEFTLRELVKNYNNGEFLFHAFSVFGPKETIAFFENIGARTKSEENNRVFPASNDAKDVLGALQKYLTKNKVETRYSSEILDVVKVGKKISKLVLKDCSITAKKYILCTGGKSYSATGSTGAGYKLAEKLGHTIVSPSPALAPIKLKETWVKDLAGISLKNIRINVLQNGKKQFSEDGEFLFTHFGVSGPAVLNISGKVGNLMKKGQVKICFDLFPDLNHKEVIDGLEDILKRLPKQSVKNILSNLVSYRLAEILPSLAKINGDKIGNNMSKLEKEALAKVLKNIEVTPTEVLGWDQAIVTRGGISLEEIDHKTMKSKIIDNLLFAGEIIDVDGKSGGFNLQMCWSTGYVAGQNCI